MNFKKDLYSEILPANSDVCLLNMPTSMTIAPPIGLGLIKAILQKNHIKTSVVFANLLFAEQVGLEKLYKVCSLLNTTTYIRDWIFSHCVFPDHQETTEKYLNLVIQEINSSNKFYFNTKPIDEDLFKKEVLFLRSEAATFIDDLAESILAKKPKIVGCGSVGSQNMASLAILKKVKALAPNIITIIGGPNCFGKMGMTMVKNFSWLDYVISGEADEIIAPLCQSLLDKHIPHASQLPAGVFSREKLSLIKQNGKEISDKQLYAITKDINALPLPDYSDYFATLKQMSYKEKINPVILLETSRGCWWGKCTFCALCGAVKLVRSKKESKILHEINTISQKYQVQDIFFVDTILPMSHFDSLIPTLSSQQKKCNLFFEIKANLNEKHIQQLAAANIKWVQPGIEALNDEFLKLMQKGASTMINLNFLKKAAEYGIVTVWVFLANFPGEKIEWFNQLAKELSLFHHLHPPVKLSYLMFHRYSHYFDFQKKYNLKLKILPSFRSLYPIQKQELYELSYDFYDENYGMPLGNRFEILNQRYKRLIEALPLWQDAWKNKGEEPVLLMKDRKSHIEVIDTRSCAIEEKQHYTGIEAAILRITDNPISVKGLYGKLTEKGYAYIENGEIDNAIEILKKNKILFEHNMQLLNLGLKKKQELSFQFSPRSDPCF